MNRTWMNRALCAMLPVILLGCNGGTYQPAGTDMEHAVYAGKASYPYNSQAELGVHLFSKVTSDTTIILSNAGDQSYANFELWVNKLYTLHIDKLDARSEKAISAKDVYNSSASNLVNAPANSITSIQIYIPSSQKLLDVQGPILPH